MNFILRLLTLKKRMTMLKENVVNRNQLEDMQKFQSLFVLVEKIISYEAENVEIAFQLLR